MKDYESYNNKGNKDIPDNPRLKKLDVYPHYQDVNKLPDEYFDIRENALDCAIDDDDNYAYDPGEKGSMDTKDSLDNIQDLTNVVNTTQASASIVESAGTVITGTATVVVGASAAVVAFNATNKVLPTMTVNTLDSGSSFVHYNLEINNLDLDKDYDIIIRNDSHSFKIDCVNGINDQYVYNLKPGLEYTLSLVGYNELLGEIPYETKTFYTLNSEERLGYSNIEIIYNDDLTCGINYKATIVDDMNKFDSTYMIMKYVDGEVLLDSRAIDRYISDNLTYSFKNNVYSGTLSLVEESMIQIDTYYNMGDNTDVLLKSDVYEIKYPISINADSESLTINGDYALIKDLKNIRIKKENLYAKVTFYNYKDESTLVEEEIDISENDFIWTTQIPNDAAYASIDVGYYDASKKYTSIKRIDRFDIYAYDPEFKANYKLWGNALKLYGGYEIPEGITNIRNKDIDYIAKIVLYNVDQDEIVINKNIEIVDYEFNLRELLYRNTEAISFDLGYYDNDEYISVLKLDKTEINHEDDYGMEGIVSPGEAARIDILWSWKDNQELADITLLTEFDSDNIDTYYKIELLQQGEWHWDEEYYDYDLLGEYIGNEKPTFKGISVNKDNQTGLTFRYTKYMRYASNSEEPEVVNIGELDYSDDDLIFDITNHMALGDFDLSSTGIKYMGLYNEAEDEYDYEIEDANITMYFFDSTMQTTYTVPLTINVMKADRYMGHPILTFNDELPASFDDITGYNIEYEIIYHEKYGGNLRTLKSDGIELVGDLYYKLGIKEKNVTLLSGNKVAIDYSFYAYIPSDSILKCEVFESVGDPIETYVLDKNTETGLYDFSITVDSGLQVNFNLYDSNDIERQSSLAGGYESYDTYNELVSSYYVSYNDYISSTDVLWTYDGSDKNALFFTGFDVVNTSDGWYEFSMDHAFNKYHFDYGIGEEVVTTVREVTNTTDKYIIAGILPSLDVDDYFEIDSVIRSYCDKGFEGGIEVVSKKLTGATFSLNDMVNFCRYEEGAFSGVLVGYDEDLDETEYNFYVPVDLYYEPDLMVQVIAGDQEYEYKLTDLYYGGESTWGGYGPQQQCVLKVSGDMGTNVQLKIKLNYSLTTEKYNKLVEYGLIDVLEGSLFNEYTVTFSN